MFGTIRKHQTWLWAVIITVTIVTFVIYFGPQSRVDSSVRSANHGTINGKKITDQDFIDAYREVHLHHFMMSGRWPDEDKRSGFEPERETYQWLLIVQKQQDLGVHVGDQAAQQVARQMLRAFERMGVSSPQVFFDKILLPRGYQVEDFERFVRHFVGIQELITTVGLSGKLIPPDQARSLYERDHRELETEAVFFWTTNYEASVQAPPEALAEFYTNQLARYRIPDRLQVSYVRFELTNYLAQAQSQLTNLNEIVDLNFQRLDTNAFPEAKTPEEKKLKLREKVIEQQALNLARAKALDFANVLFAFNPPRPENLRQLAESNQVPVQVSQPFDRDSVPLGLEVGADFAKAAFSLTTNEPFSAPIIGQDGAYVMALDKSLPSETPALDQIRDRVLADYKRGQAMRMAYQSATAFAQSLTNSLAQGKTFTNLCADLGIKPLSLPRFSISTRSLPEVEDLVPLSQFKQAAFGTPPGKPTPVLSTRAGAMLLFVKAKLPLDTSKEQTELPAYLAQLRRTRQQEAFDEWLRRESETGLRDTPLGRPQPPPKIGAKTASAS
ncbi:MAG TPA: peptidylprolyl isomerase [Verrucomicrobiae bacterium]